MIMDVLGILLAFVSIMLLFSMLVAAIVQSIGNALSLRFRYLRSGLKTLLNEINEGEFTEKAIKDFLEKISRFGNLHSPSQLPFIAKRPTHVSKDQVKALIGEVVEVEKNSTHQLQSKIDEVFPKIEALMSHQFKRLNDVLSFCIAFLLVISFQLSTPQLLSDLSQDAALRNAIEANATILISQDPQSTSQIDSVDTLLSSDSDAKVTELTSQLSYLGFELKPLDWRWILDFKLLVGFLISTILISLGAPFWYEQLRKLFYLKNELTSVNKP